jgi:hypothetical protein
MFFCGYARMGSKGQKPQRLYCDSPRLENLPEVYGTLSVRPAAKPAEHSRQASRRAPAAAWRAAQLVFV